MNTDDMAEITNIIDRGALDHPTLVAALIEEYIESRYVLVPKQDAELAAERERWYS